MSASRVCLPGTVSRSASVRSVPVPVQPRRKLWKPVETDISSRESQLVDAIRSCVHSSVPGVLSLTGLRAAPFSEIRGLFSHLAERPQLGDRANKAYAKKLVYKDSWGSGNGGDKVDQKRVIDLSPARLDAIVSVDPSLRSEPGPCLDPVLDFFEQQRSGAVPRLLRALARAAGDPSIAGDSLSNYRMADYQERPANSAPPRCGEHRDFGTMTLIFQDGVGGLEVCVDGEWRALPSEPGAASLLFGWCTAVRSNDRIPAAKHRVADPQELAGGVVPRRTSAVFFVAPEQGALLSPTLLEGQPTSARRYRSFTAGELKSLVGRKWSWREGTLSADQRLAEEEEAKLFPDQDSIIADRFGL